MNISKIYFPLIIVPALHKKIVILVFYMFSTIHAGAEELWRLRYSVTMSGESEITRGSSKTSEELNTLGRSGNLVFANGIGFGYSTVRTNGSLEGIDYKFKNHSLDLAYTIGEDLSLTLGAGRLVSGRGEQGLNGTSYATENSRGGAFFMNFGIPFVGGEFLLGYRQNKIEYKLFQNRIAGKSVILNDSIILLSSQLNAGLGFLF